MTAFDTFLGLQLATWNRQLATALAKDGSLQRSADLSLGERLTYFIGGP